MNDQPPSDRKPRRRSAPRKRAPAKNVTDGAVESVPARPGGAAEIAGMAASAEPVAESRTQRIAADAGTSAGAAGEPRERASKRKPRARRAGASAGAGEPTPDSIADRGIGVPVVVHAADAVAGSEAGVTAASGPTASTAEPSVATTSAPHVVPAGEAVARADVAAVAAVAASSVAALAASPAAPDPAIRRQDALRPGELIRVPLSVRWRDLDAFNHVNNSKYLSYLEEARLRWMLSVPGMGMDENVAPVVAASNLNYRRPIEWPGEVVVELFVERLGGSSLTVGHRIVQASDGNVLYCDGQVVMVWIDRNTGRSAPLPEGVRNACR